MAIRPWRQILLRGFRDFPIFDEVVAIFEAELSKATSAVAPFVDLPPVFAMQKIADLVTCSA